MQGILVPPTEPCGGAPKSDQAEVWNWGKKVPGTRNTLGKSRVIKTNQQLHLDKNQTGGKASKKAENPSSGDGKGQVGGVREQRKERAEDKGYSISRIELGRWGIYGARRQGPE